MRFIHTRLCHWNVLVLHPSICLGPLPTPASQRPGHKPKPEFTHFLLKMALCPYADVALPAVNRPTIEKTYVSILLDTATEKTPCGGEFQISRIIRGGGGGGGGGGGEIIAVSLRYERKMNNSFVFHFSLLLKKYLKQTQGLDNKHVGKGSHAFFFSHNSDNIATIQFITILIFLIPSRSPNSGVCDGTAVGCG